MMRTDRDLDALTYPPIDALNQATGHPQSLSAGPGAEAGHQPYGSLPATVGVSHFRVFLFTGLAMGRATGRSPR